MIRKSWAYEVAICEECNSIIIYLPASEGFPQVCRKCGVPADSNLDQEQRMRMEQANREKRM